MFNKNKKIFKVDGMKCEHCKEKVIDALMKIDEIKKVNVNLDKKEVIIVPEKNKEINLDKIKNIINDLGYKYMGD